jgi:hypothetical protein
MSTSYVYSLSESFTVTHARYLATKVATDLLRLQRFYGGPPTTTIDAYEGELVALLKGDYIETVTYGYHRDSRWVPGATLRYRARSGSNLSDDDPGQLRPGADVTNARFYSFLAYTDKWFALPGIQRQQIAEGLPFQRTEGSEPGVENGYWSTDRAYSAGGRGLARSVIRSY